MTRFAADEVLAKGTVTEVGPDLQCRVLYDDGPTASAVVPTDLTPVIPGGRVWVSIRGSAAPEVRAHARDA